MSADAALMLGTRGSDLALWQARRMAAAMLGFTRTSRMPSERMNSSAGPVPANVCRTSPVAASSTLTGANSSSVT